VTVNLFISLAAADHAIGQTECSQAVTFLRMGRSRSWAEFTVASAVVGDTRLAETGRVDGLLDDFSIQCVVLISDCAYKPNIGQKARLESGKVCVVQAVTEGDGATYLIELRPESNG
jgi:hypothetical protein